MVSLPRYVGLYSALDTVVISGDKVCWNAVFGTLVGVSVLSDYGKPSGHNCIFSALTILDSALTS